MEYKIFESLREAYRSSTHSANHFEAVLNNVRWDNTFGEDGELYFVKGGMTFITQSTNPFEECSAMAILPDASVVYF